MLKKIQSYEAFFVIILYLMPILLWSSVSLTYMPLQPSWQILSSGLLITFLGSTFLLFLISKPQEVVKEEKQIETPLPPPPQLIDTALRREHDLIKKDYDILKSQTDQLLGEIDFQKNTHIAALEIKNQEIDTLKMEMGKTAEDLKSKEDEIALLLKKIEELEYDIKTLVDYNKEEVELPYVMAPISENQALSLLKNWLEFVRKSSYDLAKIGRLIEGETSGTLFLYSASEEKPLYVSQSTLDHEIARNLHSFLPKESLEWHTAKEKLSQNKFAALSLNPDTKAVLGAVDSGPFAGYVLGVVF